MNDMTKRMKVFTKKFTVSFPEDLVEEIDLICGPRLLPRNTWLLQAARNELSKLRESKTKSLSENLKT